MYFMCDDTTHLLNSGKIWIYVFEYLFYCPKKLMLIFERLQRASN